MMGSIKFSATRDEMIVRVVAMEETMDGEDVAVVDSVVGVKDKVTAAMDVDAVVVEETATLGFPSALVALRNHRRLLVN